MNVAAERCQLALLTLLAVTATLAAGDPLCTPVNTTQGVPLPYIPVSYQTRIEMNILTKNKTYEIEEWLDGDLGNMKIRLHQNGGEIDDFIFYNATRQIYVVYNNLQCLVMNMTGDTDLDLLFGVNGQIVASAKNALRFSKEFGMEYRNTTTIRNTLVDHWYSCQRWAERKAEFEVHWYFSSKNWNSPFDRNLPIRADVKGEAGDVSQRHAFHIVYDFIGFREGLMVSDKIFDTPSGVYCENRLQIQKPPELPDLMSYTQELLISDPVLERVQYGNVFYDRSQSLVKYQFRDPLGPVTPPFYNLGSMTVVQDFSTGVSYFMDDLLGNCTDQPIGGEFFDVEEVGIKDKPGWYVVELRSPMHLFRIDNTYQFTGKRVSRGLPIERYISLRSDYPIKGRADLNFTFEYEMLDSKVSEVVIGKNKLDVGKNIPVQLRISNYKKLTDIVDPTFDYREVYNFYNFDTQMAQNPAEDFDRVQAYDLDVTACYSKREQKNLLIRFLNFGVYETFIKDEPNLFIRRATQVLNNAKMVNPLRFQKLRLDYDDEFIYLTFTLLDGPHPYAQFSRVKQAGRYIDTADATVNVGSELECLQKCNDNRNPHCNSVAFCPGSKTGTNCLMSASFKRDTQNPDPEHPCSVFIRPVSVTRPDALELSLESAFAMMDTFVQAGLIKVPMEASQPDEQGNVALINVTAVQLEQFEVRPNAGMALTGRHLFKFDVLRNSGLEPKLPALTEAVSVDECAEACLARADFDCKSVTYCYDMGECFLNDELPKQDRSNVVARARCNLYYENALATFEKEDGISRNHGNSPNVRLVTDATECARVCLGDNDCRSFDFCSLDDQLQKLCYTSASHRTDSVNQTSFNVNCTHYSKSFGSDFRREYSLKSPDLSGLSVTIVDVNLDLCTRRCVEDFGEKCNGLFYCEPSGAIKSACTIHQPGEPKVTQSSGGPLTCGYYSRQYDTDGRVWVPRSTDVVPDGFVGVSGLNVTVVSLVLVLVFALLACGAVLGLLYWRSRASGPEPAVSFSRDER